MVADPWWLVLALVLLLLPRPWLRYGASLGRRRRRGVSGGPGSDPADGRIRFRREMIRLRNHVDLLRAAAGALILAGFQGFPSALTMLGDPASARVLSIRMGILTAGLLLQTLRWERGRITFYPPVFYVAGLAFGLISPVAAALAFLAVWAFSPVLALAPAFLSAQAVLLFAFSQVFPGSALLPAALASVLCFLPVLLSVLSRRPLQLLSPRATRVP